MPNRQKMQDSARPVAVKKAAVTAPAAASAEKKKKPATPAVAVKTTAVPTSAKAAKSKSAKVAAPTKDGGVANAAKPAKVLKRDESTPIAATDKATRPAKDARQKHKLVRDSFTLPREDFELIHVLKERALALKRPTKKSELLRAGLQALARLDAADLKQRLDALVTLTPGRPKKHR